MSLGGLSLGLSIFVAVPPTSLDARRDVDPRVRTAAREAAAASHAAVIRLPAGDPWIEAALEASGVAFRRAPDGRPRHVGSLYPIDASGAVLGELAGLGWHVEIGPRRAEPTTHVTGTEIGTWAAQARGDVPFAGPTGRGITILDVDSAIDVFHPHFFHADGGAFEWIDVDGDGVLTPGIDAIDTDLDGEVAENEVLVLMDYAWFRPTGPLSREYHEGDAQFDPAFDYVFVDFDGNGRRDYGSDEGYDETTPGYGEAMFLPDDADGNGEIDVHERVILLGTSRIAAVKRGAEIWHRGVDLIEVQRDSVANAYHATGVNGILVGGQDRVFRAHRGLLPDAEIVVSASFILETYSTDAVEAIAWGVDEEDADVVLWEFGQWIETSMDGSNAIDLAVSESVASGVPHVCPAGNLGDSGKHAVSEGAPIAFDVNVPAVVGMYYLSGFTIDVHWLDPSVELTCTLRDPDDAELVIEPDTEQDWGANTVTSSRFDSPAGTATLSTSVANPTFNTPGAGIWTLECTHDGPDMVVHAYLDDPLTVWDRGAVFVDEELSSTMTSPATADGCIVTTNYQLQNPYNVEAGELDLRAGHGPRIDGGKSVDISAPSDAYTPYPSVVDDPDNTEVQLFQNNYRMFSGTSGAGPHVTSAVAQLLEVDPAATPAEIAERLQAGAATDEFVGREVPDDGWGFGKLRVFRSLYGEDPPEAPDYVASDLGVAFEPGAGECTIRVSIDDATWDLPLARWDDDYDGTWDSEFVEGSERALVVDSDTTTYAVRVEYASGGWRIGGAAITGEVPADCFDGAADTSAGGSATEGDDDTDEDAADDDDADDDDGDESSSGTAGVDDDADGCGCTTTHGRTPAWWLLVLFVVRRRALR